MRIAQSPEGRRIFPRMTVMENLQMGASLDNLKHYDEDAEKVFTLFPRLKERIGQRGGTLSGGEQQMLSIGRALMARPKLLLLDEPSLGLAPLIVKQIFDAVRELNRSQGLTVFLVEQNAFGALKLATSRLRHGQRQRDHERNRQGIAGQSGSARRLSRRRPSLRPGSLNMQGILYEEPSIWQFFFVTCLLGGWAAWMTGRPAPRHGGRFQPGRLSPAARHRHPLHPSCAVRAARCSPLQYYIVDTIVLLIIGTIGYQYTRTNQMVTQYHWLYERASLLSWKPRRADVHH